MASTTFVEQVPSTECNQCGASIDVADASPLTDITCPSCGRQTTVPGMLDQYLLTKVLGQGSAGIVYQAVDQHSRRDCAIKVFLKKKGEDHTQRVEKFLAEAKAMRSFNHPNVVKIYSVAQKAQRPYIAMELLTGERLDRIIEDRWLVEEAKAIKLGIDVAEGLKAVHDAGFAHLDVKPANMQYDGHGTCKLLDYDTARALHEIEMQGAGLVGTPYYVAPEVIQREQVDFRADIYSLGSTLFHLLAQRPPFQGATSRDVVQERLKRRAITLKEVRPDVSHETSAVIARMLEPQPRDRHDNYDELLADLRRALNAAQWDAQLKAGAAATTPTSKSPIPAALAGVVILVVIVVGILFGMRGDGNNNDRPTDNPTSDSTPRDSIASRDRSPARDFAAKQTNPNDNNTVTKDSTTVIMKDDTKVAQKDVGKDGTTKPPVVIINPNLLDPVKPIGQHGASIKPSDRWVEGKDVEMEVSDGKLTVFCVGKSPSIRCPVVPGPDRVTTPDETAALELRLRSSGVGEFRVYWNTPELPVWSKDRSQVFVVKHDNQWREHVIPIRSNAKQLELRIDLGQGAGLVDIDYIRYYLNIGKDPKPTAAWTFDEPSTGAD